MNKFKKMAMQASAALLMALSVISFSGTATITAAKSDIGNQNTMAVAWYQTSLGGTWTRIWHKQAHNHVLLFSILMKLS